MEQNQSITYSKINQRIDLLNINTEFKHIIKNHFPKRNNNQYLSALDLILKDQVWQNVNNFNYKIHAYIDKEISNFYPIQRMEQKHQKDYIQKAILLKASLYLKQGNLEEAEICFNDSIRFSQINKDYETINSGLIYLVSIYYIKEEFEKMKKTLKNFFSSRKRDVNPVMMFFACLQQLKLEKNYDVDSKSGDTKTENKDLSKGISVSREGSTRS